jgi:hypothetical protein
MTKTIAASLLLSVAATASWACSGGESRFYAGALAAAVETVVPYEDANIVEVMTIAQRAAVAEYHAGAAAPACARQDETLKAMGALTRELDATQQAMLLRDHG